MSLTDFSSRAVTQLHVIIQDGVRLERIVRVGTHREQDNLQRRLRYHYSGNKNGSVFRKHIGGAILAQADPNDPRLSYWK
jgi:hypothetical protein